MVSKLVVQNLALTGFLGPLLFLPAGTLAWAQAWAFLAVFDGCTVAFGLLLRNIDPELLAERTKSPFSADQKARDRAVIGAIGLGLGGWLVFMALDARRFGWSHVPLWAQALGGALIAAAFYAWAAVLRANRFAVPTVRLQPERGQTVISAGPYAVVRHPMYAYTMLLMVGGTPAFGPGSGYSAAVETVTFSPLAPGSA